MEILKIYQLEQPLNLITIGASNHCWKAYGGTRS